jgi:hypothetical protein
MDVQWTSGCRSYPTTRARRSAVVCRVSGQPPSAQSSFILIHYTAAFHPLSQFRARGSLSHRKVNIITTFNFTTMGIKRKHFDDASPTSLSSSGFVSTPDAQSPTRFPQGLDGTVDMEMDADPTVRSNGWDFSRAQRTKSSDWGLRTRKRVRDNRPDERVIQGT